ncbi:MAG TPA: hypothetical protein VK722_09475 [Candidatus Aquilonibacter sp.]|jgi:hypothetical protein|nr:hypothetical protein [Candidatus Aquilonibacter sp.]
MGAQPVPVHPPLSHGSDIEYKAFARAFEKGGAAVLSLIATCYYGTPGYTIFFQGGPKPHEFELLETVPHGIEPQLVTYYLGSWTSGQPLANPPGHVEITDAGGTHRVKVEHWS